VLLGAGDEDEEESSEESSTDEGDYNEQHGRAWLEAYPKESADVPFYPNAPPDSSSIFAFAEGGSEGVVGEREGAVKVEG
jgi:hypothetical protein